MSNFLPASKPKAIFFYITIHIVYVWFRTETSDIKKNPVDMVFTWLVTWF